MDVRTNALRLWLARGTDKQDCDASDMVGLPRLIYCAELLRALPPSTGARSMLDADLAKLPGLVSEAFADGHDDLEGFAQAPEELLSQILEGRFGTFQSRLSAVEERDGRIRSATVVARFQGRMFVLLAMTHPSVRRRRLATACLTLTMNQSFRHGEDRIYLAVGSGNLQAIALYEDLGFRYQRFVEPAEAAASISMGVSAVASCSTSHSARLL